MQKQKPYAPIRMSTNTINIPLPRILLLQPNRLAVAAPNIAAVVAVAYSSTTTPWHFSAAAARIPAFAAQVPPTPLHWSRHRAAAAAAADVAASAVAAAAADDWRRLSWRKWHR